MLLSCLFQWKNLGTRLAFHQLEPGGDPPRLRMEVVAPEPFATPAVVK
jgi:hypothetical protein